MEVFYPVCLSEGEVNAALVIVIDIYKGIDFYINIRILYLSLS